MSILSKLVESLKPHADRSERTTASTNQPFSRVEESGRIIRAYSGFLPCTRHTARHLLRCEHLRQLPGEGFPPYRAQPEFTHQIWIWYRTYKEPEKLYLVFRGQFDFSITDADADLVAGEITNFLAHLMIEAKDPREVLRHKETDIFWPLAVERKLRRLLELQK